MDVKREFAHLSAFIQFEIGFFLLGSIVLVFFLILNRKINTKNLLIDKTNSYNFSWWQVQFFLLAMMGIVYYTIEAIHKFGSEKIPKIPLILLLVIGGSNAIYMGRKLYSLWLNQR